MNARSPASAATQEPTLRDLIIDALKIIAPLSVALIVFAEALRIKPSEVLAYFRNRPGVMLRSLVAALIVVPAAALGLILVLEPAPAVAIGLAILVACPPAPLMIKSATQVGGGDSAFIASLHLSLAALAVVTVPAVLHVLAIPLGFSASVDPASLLSILAKTILLPIGLGLAVRALLPAWASASGALLGKAGSLGLLVVLIAILAALYPVLFRMDAWSYGVIATVAIAALAIGHLMVGSQYAEKKTVLAVECAVRHPGLAVAIGTANFTPQEALPVLLPCILVFIGIATAYLFWRGRSAAMIARTRQV
jgi:BASS family bile acid:Na+ symporter